MLVCIILSGVAHLRPTFLKGRPSVRNQREEVQDGVGMLVDADGGAKKSPAADQLVVPIQRRGYFQLKHIRDMVRKSTDTCSKSRGCAGFILEANAGSPYMISVTSHTVRDARAEREVTPIGKQVLQTIFSIAYQARC